MILIFTHKQDVHADEVIRYLNNLNIVVFRLNSEDFLLKYQITLFQTNNSWSGEIIDELGRVLEIEKLKVAWFRKANFNFLFDSRMDASNKDFISSETKALIDVLYTLPTLKWINDPMQARGAKVKFQQLLLASKMGIKIPKTIITTNPKSAKKFFKECKEEVLLKSIYTGNVTINGRNQGLLSKKISKDEFYKNYKNISLCPTQIQEYIKKDFELRITIIGKKVFAVKIDSQANKETSVDWRSDTKMNPHSIFKLPRKIEKFCLDFLKYQNLLYGAMDFIVMPSGEYVFLENNPFGQYLWLELETNVPLTEEIGNLLISYL